VAVRRAGLFEAPSNVASIVPAAPAAADASEMWRALGRSAQEIQQRLQPLLNRAAEAEARGDLEAGAAHLRQSWLAEDEAYNNAMLQSWAARASVDIGARALELESAAGDDVAQFDQSFDAARAEFVANAPPDFAPYVGALLDREYGEARNRIGQRRRNIAIERVGDDINSALDYAEARGSAYTDMTSPEYLAWAREYAAMVEAAVQQPLAGISPEQARLRIDNTLSRHRANAAAFTAEGIYEDGGQTAESAERAVAFLETFSRNPDLVLSEAQRDAFFGEGRRRIAALERERLRDLRELRAEMRAARVEGREEVRNSLLELEALSRVFVSPDEADLEGFRARVAAVGTPAMVRQLRALEAEFSVRRELHGLPFRTIEQRLDALRAEATAGGEGAPEAAIRLRAGIQYLNAMRNGDPLDVTQMHFDEAPPLLPAFSGPSLDFGPRIRHAERYAREIGAAAPSYFTPTERQDGARIIREGGEPALALVGSIVRSAQQGDGGNTDRARAMLSEMSTAGAPGLMETGTVLLLGGVRSRNTARYITEAQRLRGLEGYAPPNLPGISDEAEHRRIVARIMPPDVAPETAAIIISAADLIFEGMVAEDPGRLPRWRSVYPTAVNSALGMVAGDGRRWGGVVTLRGGNRQIAPNWIRQDQFFNIRESLTADDYVRAGGGKPPRNGRLQDWRNARLVWTGDAGRYFLGDKIGGVETYFETDSRTPYVLDFNLLRGSLFERRPDAVRR